MTNEERRELNARMRLYYDIESTKLEADIDAALKRRFQGVAREFTGTTGQASPRHAVMPGLLPFRENRWGRGGGPHDAYTDGTVCSSRAV